MRVLYFIIIGFLFSSYSLKGQENTPPPHQLATIKVLVTDYENNSKKGEQILFESLNSGIVYKGISDEDGKFEIQLPGGQTYIIKIKSIGEAEDYNKLSIPTLNEGETFTPSQLTIKFELPIFFTLDNVHFDFGKATLTKSSYTELKELLEFMKLKEDITVEIAGHTDNIGNKEDNLKLSKARADAVRNFLISNKIDSNRIIAKGYGEDRPIDTNSTPEGRQNNRRTVVRIIKE